MLPRWLTIMFVRFSILSIYFFFFNDTATTEIYTLSLHDALPILSPAVVRSEKGRRVARVPGVRASPRSIARPRSSMSDRKSTRLNSSHSQISYAVFCLKKKKNPNHLRTYTVYSLRCRKYADHHQT